LCIYSLITALNTNQTYITKVILERSTQFYNQSIIKNLLKSTLRRESLNAFGLPQTVADLVHAARRDTTRPLSCVVTGGVNWLYLLPNDQPRRRYSRCVGMAIGSVSDCVRVSMRVYQTFKRKTT